MDNENLADHSATRRKWSRRHLLLSLLSLGAWLSMRKGAQASQCSKETVIAGGWLLKKSDLN
jgi:hypothetical protein